MTNSNRNIRILSSAARFAAGAAGAPAFEERIGYVVRVSRYVRPAHAPATFPLIGTTDEHRVAFAVRFDSGLQDFKAVDQAIDAHSALVRENEQVMVTVVDDVHIADTVRPLSTFNDAATEEDLVDAELLRQSDFVDGKGRRCVAKLVLTNKGLVAYEEVEVVG